MFPKSQIFSQKHRIFPDHDVSRETSQPPASPPHTSNWKNWSFLWAKFPNGKEVNTRVTWWAGQESVSQLTICFTKLHFKNICIIIYTAFEISVAKRSFLQTYLLLGLQRIRNSKTSFQKNCFSAWASTLNMGLINEVDMVCLSPVGYGV